MKKICFALLLTSYSALSFSQELTCLDKLLPYNRYSGSHMVARDEWSDGKDALDSEGAKSALTYLVNSKLLCKSGEILIKVFPTCSHLAQDIPQSNTCFVFTNLGYFVVTRDNGRNINFIFSKDRRFSED